MSGQLGIQSETLSQKQRKKEKEDIDKINWIYMEDENKIMENVSPGIPF